MVVLEFLWNAFWFSWSLWEKYVFNVVFRIVYPFLPNQPLIEFIIVIGACIGVFVGIVKLSFKLLNKLKGAVKDSNFFVRMVTFVFAGGVMFIIFTPLILLMVGSVFLGGALEGASSSGGETYEVANTTSQTKTCSRCGATIYGHSYHQCSS